MTRVLTVGPHGGENLGDELILAAILDVISRAGGTATAMSSHPGDTSELHSVAAVPQVNVKRREFRTLGNLGEYDFLLLAGGEQLAEGRFHNPLWGHLANAWVTLVAAARQRIPFALYSVGAETVKTPLGRWMLRTILRRAVFVGARDQRSFAYLREMAPKANIHLTADPVLLLEPTDFRAAQAILRRDHRLPAHQPILVFCPADDHRVDTSYVDDAMMAMISAAEQLDGVVLVIAMEHQPSYDPRLLKRPIFSHPRSRIMPLEDFNAAALVRLFAGADQVTSARMHPLIVAASQGTPWISINRNAKLENFAKELVNPGVPIDVDAAELAGRVVAQIEHGREAWKRASEDALQPLLHRASQAELLLRDALALAKTTK